MSNFIFYFCEKKDGFTFILREESNSTTTKEQALSLLDRLAERFFKEYPNAGKWNGNLAAFEGFTALCDEILQTRPTRQGFPLIFQIVFKPFVLAPVQQITPVRSEWEIHFGELRSRFKTYTELIDRRDLRNLLEKPHVFYLPNTRHLVFIYAFRQELKSKEISHLLCYFVEEKEWFTFYQLISLFQQRAQRILQGLIPLIERLERDPLSNESKQEKKKIQEAVNEWGDLNQYINAMQVSIFQEFRRSGMPSSTLADDQIRTQLEKLNRKIGQDIDKVIFALLGQQQVVFVANDRNLVELSLSAVLAYYPLPSVILWTEGPSDCRLVGTRPNQINNYEKNAVIVDIVNNKVIGGEKNEFCSNLFKEAMIFARESSVIESRKFFQQKVSSIFTLLKDLLEILSLEENRQQERFQNILEGVNTLEGRATIHLLLLMSENLNPLLARKLKKFLDLSGRFVNFFREIQA